MEISVTTSKAFAFQRATTVFRDRVNNCERCSLSAGCEAGQQLLEARNHARMEFMLLSSEDDRLWETR